jgi:hypothetical protein
MARPSIFSREYERRMKRRKKIVVSIVLMLIAASGIFFAFGSGTVKQVFKDRNINLTAFLNKENIPEAKIENEPIDNKQIDSKPVEQVTQEEGYDIELSDGTKVKAIYDDNNGIKKFKYITPSDKSISFTINPSGTNIVILDSKVQRMYSIDINGNKQDITDEQYTSIKREPTITKRPEYIWCTSPKFIDDENIAYLSQLPHVSSKVTKKFFWTVNLKNKNLHKNKYNINGENIKLGTTTDKGLEVVLDDGSVKYININNGNIKVN